MHYRFCIVYCKYNRVRMKCGSVGRSFKSIVFMTHREHILTQVRPELAFKVSPAVVQRRPAPHFEQVSAPFQPLKPYSQLGIQLADGLECFVGQSGSSQHLQDFEKQQTKHLCWWPSKLWVFWPPGANQSPSLHLKVGYTAYPIFRPCGIQIC